MEPDAFLEKKHIKTLGLMRQQKRRFLTQTTSALNTETDADLVLLPFICYFMIEGTSSMPQTLAQTF